MKIFKLQGLAYHFAKTQGLNNNLLFCVLSQKNIKTYLIEETKINTYIKLFL